MRKKLLLILTAVILLCAILVAVSWALKYTAQKPIQKVSDNFVQSMLADKPDDVYQLFDTKAKSSYSQAAWEAEANNLSTFFYGKSPKRTSTQATKTSATVNYAITGQDGPYVITVHMTQESGAWKIQSFESIKQS